MGKCILDLSHHCLKKSIASYSSNPHFLTGLNEAKAKIEADHTSCSCVVQKFFGNKKFAHLQDRIWKYDWAPSGVTGAHRKSWRMIVIVPDSSVRPYQLVAAAIYAKSTTSHLSGEELARIFLEFSKAVEPLPTENDKFRRVSNGDHATRSLCYQCGDFGAVGTDSDVLSNLEAEHECVSAPLETAIVEFDA
jgi:hypothetical protein